MLQNQHRFNIPLASHSEHKPRRILARVVVGLEDFKRELGLGLDGAVAAPDRVDDVKKSALWYFETMGNCRYISVRGGNVETAVWAHNDKYENFWPELDTGGDETVRELYFRAARDAGYREGDEPAPSNEWTACGHMVRLHRPRISTMPSCPWWLDMLTKVAHRLPDVHLILNTEDFPRRPRFEANEMWGLRPRPGRNFATPHDLEPPFSSCTSEEYLDHLWPTRDDWALCLSAPSRPCIDPGETWHSRSARAVFRGSPSGPGTDAHSNLRLALCALSRRRPDLIDSKITKWTSTIKHEGGKLTLQRRDDALSGNFMSVEEQAAAFKYAVCPDGHVAAYRMSALLLHGMLVLKPESKWRVWYDRHLTPWVHYVPLAADLSDLEDKIVWCRNNDTQCLAMARAGMRFAQRVCCNETALLDFLAHQISTKATRLVAPAHVAAPPLSDLETRVLRLESIEFERSTRNYTTRTDLTLDLRGPPDLFRLAAVCRAKRGFITQMPGERGSEGFPHITAWQKLSDTTWVASFSRDWRLCVSVYEVDDAAAILHAERGFELVGSRHVPQFVHAQRLGGKLVVWREHVDLGRATTLDRLVGRKTSPRVALSIENLKRDLYARGYRVVDEAGEGGRHILVGVDCCLVLKLDDTVLAPLVE